MSDDGVPDEDVGDGTSDETVPTEPIQASTGPEQPPPPEQDDGPSKATRPPKHHGRAYPVWVGLAVLLAFFAVAAAVALVVIDTTPQSVNTAPAAPFYVAPNPLPGGNLGTIVRSEPITTGGPAGTATFRILYLSTAWNTNSVIVTSGTLYVPTGGAVPAGGRPIVAWAHPTTGIASQCAPSLADDGGTSVLPGLQAFINSGYVVVATDYPGLGTQGMHPYLVGVSEGRAVLDSVRAARAFPGTNTSTSFVTWGHSQGGQASLFAGQLAASYAPELTLVGVTAAAPATELGTLLQEDLGTTLGNVLGSLALVSWSQVYPNTNMNQIVPGPQVNEATNIASRCITSTWDILEDLPLAEHLKLRFTVDDPATTPPWSDWVQQNTPGASPIKAPMLVMQGTADPVVNPQVTANWVSQQCSKNEAIDYQTMPGVDHTSAGFQAAPTVVSWTQARFNNGPVTNNCSNAGSTTTSTSSTSTSSSSTSSSSSSTSSSTATTAAPTSTAPTTTAAPTTTGAPTTTAASTTSSSSTSVSTAAPTP